MIEFCSKLTLSWPALVKAMHMESVMLACLTNTWQAVNQALSSRYVTRLSHLPLWIAATTVA